MRFTTAIDLQSLEPADVERAGRFAPTAFRVWRAGVTRTDRGAQFFTERSASIILGDQAARQNLYSIDVDHLSLSETAPPEARKAVGWHKLEVRKNGDGAPELWAVGVEWTDIARAGLEKDPPEWRYFSPAYDVDQETREVTRYLNTALTNNPATWSVTALATRREGRVMTKKEMIAVFQHMAKGESGEAQACAAVLAMLETGKVPEDDGEPKKDEEPKKEDPPKKDEPEKSTEEPAGAGDLRLAAKVQELSAWRDAREETEERARLMASRPDLDADVAQFLERSPLPVVRDAVKTLPRGKAKTVLAAAQAATSVQATRGENQGSESSGVRADYDLHTLDVQMGLAEPTNAIRHEGTRMFLGSMTPAQAKATIAARAAAAGKGK